jgi:micrococcal nuclease
MHAVTANQPGTYAIARFVDGDTIVVDMNGHNETVRFVGVDTPETHKPKTPVQCYGLKAADFTKQTIGKQRVRLQMDELSSDRDRYNRLLRYVYLPDGTLLNQQLIEQGYGFYYPYFPFSKSADFAASQLRAQTKHAGLWSSCQPKATDQGGYKMGLLLHDVGGGIDTAFTQRERAQQRKIASFGVITPINQAARQIS